MRHIKICGITNSPDALFAAECGATMLGFIFYPPSTSNITPEKATAILNEVEHCDVQKIGVVVDKSAKELTTLLHQVPLNGLQVHGTTTPEDILSLNKSIIVIKAFRVRKEQPIDELARQMRLWQQQVPSCFFLLDTYSEEVRGGTGKVFDWSVAETLAKEFPLILSGGLHAENVFAGITKVKPYGVDAKTGVELTHGIKDPKKIMHFIQESNKAFMQGEIA